MPESANTVKQDVAKAALDGAEFSLRSKFELDGYEVRFRRHGLLEATAMLRPTGDGMPRYFRIKVSESS